MKDKKVTISHQTFLRLAYVVKMFMKSTVGRRAWVLVASLLLLMLCINGMNVMNSYVGRYFMSAIESKDMGKFVWYAWIYAAVFAGSTVVAVFFRFAEERLGLLWREWLTHRITGLYVDQRVYLHLEAAGGLTNPDQRMTEDVKQLTTSTLSFLLMILNGSVTAVSFSGVLWAISPTLFGVAVLYAAVGSALTIFLGRPLIRLNYRQADFEADFRSELIRVRENAVGIALTGNQGSIRERLTQRIDQLVGNFRVITAVNRNLNFFTTGYNYMIQLIPTLLVAPLFIHGEAEFGVIGQSAMAFATLVAAFSLIVTQFQAISSYASVVARLGEFVEAAEKSAARNDASCIGCITGSCTFTFTHFTLRAADASETLLLNDLNVSLVPGRNLLVHGPNQNARLALFHACAGLYHTGSGSMERPPEEKLAFLPEQPYLPAVTARELLVPKGKEQSISNEDLAALFKEIGLESSKFRTLDDFNIERNWQDALSLSKQQLLSVARAILNEPSFIFLDRLGSALKPAARRMVWEALRKRGITCIAFEEDGVDSTLHDDALVIQSDGSWQWEDLKRASVAGSKHQAS